MPIVEDAIGKAKEALTGNKTAKKAAKKAAKKKAKPKTKNLKLPTHPRVSKEDAERIVSEIKRGVPLLSLAQTYGVRLSFFEKVKDAINKGGKDAREEE